jgi:hypothetical protein
VLSRDEILANYTVFTAIDRNYLRIFSLWLDHFERSGYLPCLRVATFDSESERFVRAKGIAVAAIDERIQDPRQLYVARLNEIAALIASGRNVIHSDADAFWLKPDLPSLIDDSRDLQISVGHGMPQAAIDEWGFSLCCGFFVLHASPQVERFLDAWIEKGRQLSNDQIALNELLLDRQLRWQPDGGPRTVGASSSLDLRVEAISHDVVSRTSVGPGVQIYHPYLSSRSESNKLLQLKARAEPSRLRRMFTYVRLALNVSAWPEVIGGKTRRVLRRARAALEK